ncbi:hypothetical protein PAXINDRAFT_12572 [Paxillus involutus ATCC 200175]|uniref:J domain-containing protein n=1 Tax=Paxillus involutus ATCC 200175 TaxID=664439 RepID=A0A0C9SY21_PAXIN|nr:hypothetical protein PAXINDRAFT_12572 [Paxillus involutus ATCC 200175]
MKPLEGKADEHRVDSEGCWQRRLVYYSWGYCCVESEREGIFDAVYIPADDECVVFQKQVGRYESEAPTSSAALAALRASHDTQASEEALRLTHKDAVDARLASWRAGKEANVRALLTTLDSVLWPELGWKRVGMAEVVGAGQVKGAYVRAIARVHPDKLNANNTTVEQRMIANGVFGALNEAWNAFQQQS